MTDPTKLAASITAGTAHATTADIRDIIAAHRAEVENELKRPRPPVFIPPAKLQTASLNVPAERVAQQDAPPPRPAPKPLTDEELAAFLQGHLPALIQATEDLVKPPFRWGEVWQLASVVSGTVKDALPHAQGVEASSLVTVLTRYLWRTYGVPLLPTWAQGLAGVLEGLIVSGIEAAYQFTVKRVQGG